MLTVRDHMAIRLAAASYRYAGARESDVRHQLGWSMPVFARHVNVLLDRPAALAAYPVEVKRLRRIRDARRRVRAA
ncbi:DUF3263 domain-containing protein [Nocardioides sp. J54]|uniref:DUF3263 domain-containing protein n=1 Tax=Nocardioides sp. J54 TaxID=935866 RepID=UPI0004B19CD9|nr:DUF3263 domain-containing protein [Nocardioides sp. J54]